MIVYRGGAELRACDGCYRLARTGEEGWTRGKAMRPHRTPNQVDRGEEGSALAKIDVDWCPECRPNRAVA